EAAGEDVLQGSELLARRAAVEVEDPRPGRAGLAVRVASRQSRREPCDVDSVHLAVVDHPGEHAHAFPVGGAPARPAVDAAAGSAGVAVAGLAVRAPDMPAHGCISIPMFASMCSCAGIGSWLRIPPPRVKHRTSPRRAWNHTP